MSVLTDTELQTKLMECGLNVLEAQGLMVFLSTVDRVEQLQSELTRLRDGRRDTSPQAAQAADTPPLEPPRRPRAGTPVSRVVAKAITPFAAQLALVRQMIRSGRPVSLATLLDCQVICRQHHDGRYKREVFVHGLHADPETQRVTETVGKKITIYSFEPATPESVIVAAVVDFVNECEFRPNNDVVMTSQQLNKVFRSRRASSLCYIVPNT